MSRVFCAVLLLSVCGFSFASAQFVSPGYDENPLTVAPAGVFVGGFEVLSSGNYALFDGTDVLEVSSVDGSVVAVLHTPAGFVFGAFLTLGPRGDVLYFGESSVGEIIAIDLGNLSTTLVATVSLPFDMEFDPSGRAFVSWASGFGQPGILSHLDLNSGALDDVLATTDAAGPFVFEATGDLAYVVPDTSTFPPPPDTTRLYRFTLGQVEGALGDGHLLEADGELLANLDGGFDLAADEAGDLFVSDPNFGTVVEVDAESGDEQLLYDVQQNFVGNTYLKYVPALQGAFERFQPGDSGQLVTLQADFVTLNDAIRIDPRRPMLSTNPPGPVPAGSFKLNLEAAVPNGFALVLVGGGTTAEQAIPNQTWPAPLFLGLSFAPLIVVGMGTDGDGSFAVDAVNPGLGGVSLGIQAIVGETAAGPFYGTSQPLELILD